MLGVRRHPMKYKTTNAETIVDIVAQVDVKVLESYSTIGSKLRTDLSREELLEDIKTIKHSLQYSLFANRFDGKFQIRVIHLNAGGTRETVDGWGLISLQIQKSENFIEYDFTANSEKRAKNWESTNPNWGPVRMWNWTEIERTLRKLKRLAASRDV
jgi:hypothetical protein